MARRPLGARRVRPRLVVLAALVGGMLAAVAIPVLVGDRPPPPPPLWRVDYETGDLSQTEGAQEAAAERVTVVRSPVAEGRFAARFEARQGEQTGGDTASNRSEVLLTRYRDHPGDERWYRWLTYLPPDFPDAFPDDFASLMQWKRDDQRNPLPLGVGIRGPNLRITSSGTRYLGPISRGRWHEIVVHVKWSTDPDEGFLEAWLDDRRILDKVHLQNVFTDARGRPIPHYLKQGLYKSDRIPSTYVVHDGLLIGTTRGSVDR